MQISPPNDDSSLKRLNRPAEMRGAETKPVNELEEITPPVPIGGRHEHDLRVDQPRRREQRRKRKQEVLLDTRSGHEQRTDTRRKDDLKAPKEKRGTPSLQGIDIVA